MTDFLKQIPLTQNKFTLVDDEDYEYLMQWKWRASFDPHTKSFRAVRSSPTLNGKRKTIYIHRVIMNVHDYKTQVDHVNHDTLNNCKSNLRIATIAQNNANVRKQKNCTSQYLGVSWHKPGNKWLACIRKDRRLKHIGLFKNEFDAAKAYNLKAIELHGVFANLNLIPA